MTQQTVELPIVSFAWTATHETADYKHYPPYVNLTGNRLAVRGPEGTDGEHPQMGLYVAVELPDEAIAELRDALCGDLIKEAVEALKRIAASDINDPSTLHPSACANVARATLTKLTGEKQ